MPTDRNALADKIADRLFINGFGERGNRLKLIQDTAADEKDLGGWCPSAVRDQVLLALEDE